MQQIEVKQTEIDNLQQKQCSNNDDNDEEEEKKKKFKLPHIEIPDKVKIFLLALLKQVGIFFLSLNTIQIFLSLSDFYIRFSIFYILSRFFHHMDSCFCCAFGTKRNKTCSECQKTYIKKSSSND